MHSLHPTLPKKVTRAAAAETAQADWVLIGEGSHGTHEYYQLRADITRLLIEQRGFNAVGAEAGERATI